MRRRSLEKRTAGGEKKPGDGTTFPTTGDTVVCHYTGSLTATGDVFDSSMPKGRPFEVCLGKGEVIQGWDRAFTQISVGEQAVSRMSTSRTRRLATPVTNTPLRPHETLR